MSIFFSNTQSLLFFFVNKHFHMLPLIKILIHYLINILMAQRKFSNGCFTSLLEKKSGNSVKISVTSNCPYHYEQMQYKHAATSSSTMPCTNVPIHYPLCPT